MDDDRGRILRRLAKLTPEELGALLCWVVMRPDA
jgi:hypothetical protein